MSSVGFWGRRWRPSSGCWWVERVQIWYRVHQFYNALFARPSAEELEQARAVLSPATFTLFTSQQLGEQVHCLRIFHSLCVSGEQDPDLLAAALLHDVGKIRRPLRAWERALIVLAKEFAGERAAQWGRAEPHGWRAAFAVAEQHPTWGADMAREAGATGCTVSLIRRHQDPAPQPPLTPEDRLLLKLQRLDNRE